MEYSSNQPYRDMFIFHRNGNSNTTNDNKN